MIECDIYVTPTHTFLYTPFPLHTSTRTWIDETRRQLLTVMLDVGDCWRKCKILFFNSFFHDGPTCEMFSFAPLLLLITHPFCHLTRT
jgi:hypothetical protein